MEGYEIRLVKSLIGISKKHKRIIGSLGLGRINSVSRQKKNRCIEGMIRKVRYLIQIKEIEI